MLRTLEQYPILKIIGQVADRCDTKVWVVGGFVRDLLLNRECYDIDVVCVGDGIDLAKKVAGELNVNSIAIYRRFGTAMFHYNDIQIEFVGARKESYTEDSRKPIVSSGTFEDDQKRRDFTINTLAISLNGNSYGNLQDTFNGIGDLNNGIIRTPVDPNVTFYDDPLRMLRAIRFACQLCFNICDETINAIIQCSERIRIISQDRITSELNKILLSDVPSVGFYLLSRTGLLKIILPEIENLKGQDCVQHFSHKDIFKHTLQVVDNVAKNSDDVWLRWTALLHDVAKPVTKHFDKKHGFTFHGHDIVGSRMVKDVFARLKLPISSSDYVAKLVGLHLRPIAIAQDCVSDSGIRRLAYDAGKDISDLMILCRADITSHNPVKISEYMRNFEKVEKKIEYINEKDHIRNLQPVITGEMIMKELNIEPGPIIGKIKTQLKNAIINGEVENTYDELHKLMVEIVEGIKHQ